jgi:Na+(H+)/acetate symporter ActP
MKKVFAFAILIVFVIVVLAGCLFFLLALFGGLKGSMVANIMVIILLVAPFVIRLVYLKMRPNRTFDNFLLENDIEEKDEVKYL